jgi:nitroreductase
MDAYTVIRSKRDSRAYREEPIPPQALHRILQAGRMAGSAKNRQPCRFVVLQERAGKEELAACGHFAAHLPLAPLVVAVLVPGPGHAFDAGRAAQNMMLAAWAEGITSCPVAMHEADCARRVLGLPEGHGVAIAIAFGYPQSPQSLSKGVPRLPLQELVHYERW